MKYILACAIIICAVVVFFEVFNSYAVTGHTLPREKNDAGVIYELFYIEGMPCMRIGRGGPNNTVWNYDGVTCDWSKWNGQH